MTNLNTTTLFKAGDKLASRTINKALWRNAAKELRSLGYISGTEGKGGAKKHVIGKDVPGKDLVKQEALTKLYTHTLDDLLSGGVGIIEELQGEMADWRDGMSGTGLENTEKYSMVEECADTLEAAHSELECIDLTGDGLDDWHVIARTTVLEDYPVVVDGRGRTHGDSRDARLAEAVEQLAAVKEQLETFVADHGGDSEDDWPEDIISAIRDRIDALDDALRNVEGVEFPGMF